jgi:uncharacterized protein (UPF0335 family)
MSDAISANALRQFISKIERLEEEKVGVLEAIKEVYEEAKSSGFDPKIMRQVIKLRRMDKDDLEEREALIDLYMQALGV